MKMANLDTFDTARTETAVRIGNPFAALAAAVQDIVDHHRERKLIVRLSRLPDHIVRDMGFDPVKVVDALDGSWDDVTLTRSDRR
jgi:hypothetical protein